MRNLLKMHGFAPAAIVTDKLPSYRAALNDLGMGSKHVTGGRINNRPEKPHLPVRQGERRMQRFESAALAQRFLSRHGAAYNTSYIQRHLIARNPLRHFRSKAMKAWETVTAAA